MYLQAIRFVSLQSGSCRGVAGAGCRQKPDTGSLTPVLPQRILTGQNMIRTFVGRAFLKRRG